MLREYKFGGPLISSHHLNPLKKGGHCSTHCSSPFHFLKVPEVQEAMKGSATNTTSFLCNSSDPKQVYPGRWVTLQQQFLLWVTSIGHFTI